MKNEEKGNEKGCLEFVKEMFDGFTNSEECKKHAGKNKKGKKTQGDGGYIELRVVKTETLYSTKDTKAGNTDQASPEEEK